MSLHNKPFPFEHSGHGLMVLIFALHTNEKKFVYKLDPITLEAVCWIVSMLLGLMHNWVSVSVFCAFLNLYLFKNYIHIYF